MLLACGASLGRAGEAWNVFCSCLSLSGLIAGGSNRTGWALTGISNLQKMFGQVTVSLPHSAGPHGGGWSDVLQTDSSGTCKWAAPGVQLLCWAMLRWSWNLLRCHWLSAMWQRGINAWIPRLQHWKGTLAQHPHCQRNSISSFSLFSLLSNSVKQRRTFGLDCRNCCMVSF